MIDAQPVFENEFIKEQTVFIPDSLYFSTIIPFRIWPTFMPVYMPTGTRSAFNNFPGFSILR